jgi:acyl carrier protein
MSLADIGLDSVAIVSLLSAVEEFVGVVLTEGDLAGVVTVGDLVQVIQKRIYHDRSVSAA